MDKPCFVGFMRACHPSVVRIPMAFSSSSACLDNSFLLSCRPQSYHAVDLLACTYSDVKPLQRRWPSSTSVQMHPRRPAVWRPIRCVLDDAVDPPIQPPQYYTYDDPITGEPAPAQSPDRNTLPDRPFWSSDVPAIARKVQANVPRKPLDSRKVGSKTETKAGSRRRGAPKSSGKGKQKQTQPIPVFEQKEEEDEDEYRDEYVRFEDPQEGKEKPAKEEEKRELTQLPNEKLWFNWRQIPPEKQPWHEWCTPAPDAHAAMAAAAAKTGQIKLFGEKPTVAEATLARIRRHALKQERLDMEKKRRKEIGPVAYYSEWVKGWKEDTSKEAVQKHFEETGEDVSSQLLSMFERQTHEEYRLMMGTDSRIERDPLAMRMTLEQKKAVWGGDPVYPTVNYYQDPNAKIDYRGPNFHEPHTSIWESLEKAGRVITREQLRKIQEEEAASQYAMERDMEDAIAGAVDIGEKEEEEEGKDEKKKEGDEEEEEEEKEGEEDVEGGGEEEEEKEGEEDVEGVGEEEEEEEEEKENQGSLTLKPKKKGTAADEDM